MSQLLLIFQLSMMYRNQTQYLYCLNHVCFCLGEEENGLKGILLDYNGKNLRELSQPQERFALKFQRTQEFFGGRGQQFFFF